MRIFRGIRNCYTLDAVSQGCYGSADMDHLSHIENAAIVERDGRIQWIGPEAGLQIETSNAEVIHLGCETLLPGFVEAHTHLLFAGSRAHEFEMRNRGATYLEISKSGGGILSTVDQTRKTSKQALKDLAIPRVQSFVSQGVTALEVKSGYGLSHAAEIKMLEAIRELVGPKVISTFLGPHSVPRDLSKDQYLQEVIEKTLPEVARRHLADRADIFIEDSFFSKQDAKKYFAAAQDLGLGLTGHVEQLSRQGGARLLCELESCSADHLVEISSEDIQMYAQPTAPVAVLLPAADFYLKMSYPPARELLAAGACVALATDFNPGSSPTQSLSFVGVLARLQMGMSLPEVICAYTVNAAKALNLVAERGSLSVGKVCDFVGFNCALDQLFYQVGTHPVILTYRDGVELWRNRNLTHR